MAIRKYSITKKDLVDNGYFVEGEKVFKHRSNGVKEIKQYTIVGKHKYGKEKNYIYVSLKIERLNIGNRQIHVGLHNVIYAWYKGEVPLGYEVDHIDGDSLNNKIDNLQLLTHEKNLQRRSIKGVNHWFYTKGYTEESWAKRQQELKDIRDNRKIRKELKPKYDLYMKILKADLKRAWDEDDLNTLYVLSPKRITFKEFINRYKEVLL